MPKKIDYPRGSFKNSLQLAQAVHELGGECAIDLAADKLDKKVSGAFRALVGASNKYGLILSKQGRITTSSLYRDYKLAYTEEEAHRYLTQAFLNPEIFQAVYNRFLGSKLPVDHFEKLLIREFDVPENVSSRVSKYFLDGAKQCGLLTPENMLTDSNHDNEDSLNFSDAPSNGDSSIDKNNQQYVDPVDNEINTNVGRLEEFSVRIYGPGIDSSVVIKDDADLMIVDAMLAKVRNQIKVFKESEDTNNSDEDELSAK